MKHFTINHLLFAVIALFAGTSTFAAEEVCHQFDYFYANITAPNGVKKTDIYSVSFVGSDAVLNPLSEDIPYGAHLAYNHIEKLLYVVNEADGSIQTLDPITNDWSTVIAPDVVLDHITTASISPDGKLLLGSQDDGVIYQANFSTDPYTVTIYEPNNDISGGDLVFTDVGLYLASKPSGYFYVVLPGFPNILLGQVDGNVTGLAKADDGETVMLSALGNTSFLQYDISGGVNQINEFNALLNGEPFTLGNGDMASGCSFSETYIEVCEDFRYYYIADNTPGVANGTVFQGNIVGGDFVLTELFQAGNHGHIAMNEDNGEIYVVHDNGSDIKTFDANGNHLHTAAITGLSKAVALVWHKADGQLYVGSQTQNEVYTVDPASGAIALYADSLPVYGGDLFSTDNGELRLVSRLNNTTSEIYDITSGTPIYLYDVAKSVNGAAIAPDGGSIMSEGNNSFNFHTYDSNGIPLGVLNSVDVNGDPFALFDGDMASGCNDGNEPLIIGCYGFEVLDFDQGLKVNGQPVAGDRSDPEVALGEPDRSNAPGGFVSLGVGGYITIGFSGMVMDEPGNDIKIWETSYSGNVCGGGDDEYADIELSQDGVNFVSVGTICRNDEVDMAAAGLPYVVAIRITNSSLTGTPDGYDVDGVEAIHGCSAFPIIETGECYAAEVVEHIQGTSKNGGAVATNRTDATKALGEPERVDQLVFVSLGYGGSLTLAFDGAIPNGAGDDIEIIETSYNTTSCAAYREYADVYVSVDGTDWFLAGTVCKFEPFIDISDAGAFPYVNFVRIVNNDSLTTTQDGFDVDGVVALHNCEGVVEEEVDEEDYTNPFADNNNSQTFMSVYPNPTSSTTSIEFVPNNNEVTTVEVMDMNGRVVKTLLNEKVQAGESYKLNFDGSSLPNGIYIARFNDGENVVFNKIMIAK